MRLDFVAAMSIVGVAITLGAYGVLLSAMHFKGKRPSPIAWIGFGFCTGVGYAVQWAEGVKGPSWTMGVTAFFCFVVGLDALLLRYRDTKRSGTRYATTLTQWAALGLGLITFAAWAFCYAYRWSEAWAAVLATASDLLLYIPAIIDDWKAPELDSRFAYFLNTIKFVPGLAVMAWTFDTVLYPLALVCANTGMNLYLMLRQMWLGREMTIMRQGLIDNFWSFEYDSEETDAFGGRERRKLLDTAVMKVWAALATSCILVASILWITKIIPLAGVIATMQALCALAVGIYGCFADKLSEAPEGVSYPR